MNVSIVTGILAFNIAVPSSENITGMLGNYNGNPNDDFVLRNGTMLPSNSTETQLYSFGQSYEY